MRALTVPQIAFMVFGELPASFVDPLREPKSGQILQPVDLLFGADARGIVAGLEVVVADDPFAGGLVLQCPVDLGPLLASHHAFPCLQHLGFKPRSKLPRRELLAPRADARTQIFTIDFEFVPIVAHTTHQQVHVGVVGVVMVDRDPFELRPKVMCHLGRQLADVVAQIEPAGVFGDTIKRHRSSSPCPQPRTVATRSIPSRLASKP